MKDSHLIYAISQTNGRNGLRTARHAEMTLAPVWAAWHGSSRSASLATQEAGRCKVKSRIGSYPGDVMAPIEGTRSLLLLIVFEALRRGLLHSRPISPGFAAYPLCTRNYPGDQVYMQGVLSGLQWFVHHQGTTSVALLYMDGDVDLTIPAEAAAAQNMTGILNSMVSAQLAQRPGC